jgi:hypothetical protein
MDPTVKLLMDRYGLSRKAAEAYAAKGTEPAKHVNQPAYAGKRSLSFGGAATGRGAVDGAVGPGLTMGAVTVEPYKPGGLDMGPVSVTSMDNGLTPEKRAQYELYMKQFEDAKRRASQSQLPAGVPVWDPELGALEWSTGPRPPSGARSPGAYGGRMLPGEDGRRFDARTRGVQAVVDHYAPKKK